MTFIRITTRSLIVAPALAGGAAVLAQTQVVSKDQIVPGTLQDLSGPLAGYGKDLRNGMQMRVAEVNDKGACTAAGSV